MVRRRDTRRGGQALIEMAIVVFLLILLVSGIIEFGRLFMIANMITHAARDGGRFAATLPVNNGGTDYRDGQGCFTGEGSSIVEDHVTNMMTNVMGEGTTPAVSVTQGLDGSIPTVTVQIDGQIDIILLMGFWETLTGDTDVDVSRTMTFRDEQRALDQAC